MSNNVKGVNFLPKTGTEFCQTRSAKNTQFGNENFAHEKISFNGKREARYFLRWISKNFSSPQQRAVLGITALCTQPFIDLNNKHIKKEDKSVVVARTIAKIVVGTLTGIALRHYAIKAIKQFTKSVKVGKYSQSLLPASIVESLKKNPTSVSEISLMNYRNGLGTLLGVTGGLFTNFLVDAPLTKIMTNQLNEKVFLRGEKNAK